MAEMLAIISKAVFEKAAGKNPSVGTVLGMDRYVSTNKNLAPLAGGGTLYLVTVRPGDVLWLVAVLERPTFDGAQWTANKCATPITDISTLIEKLKFESGTGINAAAGQLGMSLQTPRKLTAEDRALLDAAIAPVGGAAPAATRSKPPPDDVAVSSGGRSNALLDAIIADPDNDGARQVFADALMQRNDTRGELIFVESALAGPLSIRKREQLAQRRAELLAKHGKEWFPYKLGEMRTSRGFLYAVKGTLGQINGAAEMFDKEPIVEVEVIGVEDAAKLAKAKWLPRVRNLIVRGSIGDDGFATLCACEHLARLASLNVTNNELSSEALEALDGNLPACRTLVLTGNAIGDDGIAALGRWKSLGSLVKLYLSSCEISDDGVAGLFVGGAPLASLEKLTLSKNEEVADTACSTIASNASKLPALRLLELTQTSVGLDGVKALMKAKLPDTMRLDVRRTVVGADDAAEFGGRVHAGDGRG